MAAFYPAGRSLGAFRKSIRQADATDAQSEPAAAIQFALDPLHSAGTGSETPQGLPTTLVAGDIAIVGMKGLGPGGTQDDSFAFVLLRNIGSGTVINFTDNEWVGGAGGAFNGEEGTYTWTASADMTAGTVVTVSFDGAATTFNFSSQVGDQLFAYQGSLASPTLLAGLQTRGPFKPAGQGTISVSELPPGLTLGTNAVTVDSEPNSVSGDGDGNINWAYAGPRTGSVAEILAAIHTTSNWTGGDDYQEAPYPGTFSIGAPAAPAEITLRGNNVDIVDGDLSASYEDFTLYGQTGVSGGTIDRVFTILNQGGTALSIGAISITGAAASDFTVFVAPASSIAPSGSTTFTLRFDPTAAGLRTASIAIVNGDSNENPYNFTVSGSGTVAGTSLVAGDVAIVGFNGNFDYTQFAFVLLKAVVAGTVIKFTDASWTGSALNATESAVQWVAPTDLPFGTIVAFDEANLAPSFQAISDGYFSGTRFHVDTAGDQIFAYVGTGAAPTFLAGLHTDASTFDGVWAGNSQSSQVPTGLADGATAISFANGSTPYVSGIYVGSTTGDRAALLAKINNEANWQGSGASQTLPTGPYGSGSSAPEIDVQYQVGAVAVADGDVTPSTNEGTLFDPQNVTGGSQSHVFVIRNLGDQTLNLGTITVTGANASEFTFTLGSTTIGATQSTTLTVTFDPAGAGARTATITIPSNDSDEASYDFLLRGVGRDSSQTLAAGDIAFTGFRSGENDFSFVLLKAVAAGTSIKFTDGGWTGTTFRQSEGAVEWIAPTNLPAGTVIEYDGQQANGGVDWTRADTVYFTGLSFEPDVVGDQIIAYQGTASAGGAGIVNLAALYFDKTTFDSTYTDTTGSSRVPTGLVDGQTAISFGKPDGVSAYSYGAYTGPTNLDFTQQRLAINNEANWTGSDSSVTFPTGPIGNSVPTQGANAGLTLNEGATQTITAALLDYNDAEQADSAITYTVTAAATNGILRRNGVTLAVSGTFTQADINGGLITYVHNGSETTSASFGFSVSDGIGSAVTGQSFAFTVTPVNDLPTIGANLGLTLNEGATGTVTTARLDYNDAESSDTGIIYTITAAAANGTLRLSGNALGVGGTFTQDDINNNRITYVHNGGETTSDSVGFSVSDGTATVTNQSFALTVTPVNDLPTVGANLGLTLNEGATGTVTTARLDYNDAEQADTAITYTVTAAATNGTLRLSGNALGVGGTFTQDDINNNRVTYVHNGGETTSDSIGFSVSDGTATVTNQSFALTVTPVDDPAVAVNDTGNVTTEDATVSIAVLGNDSDADGIPAVARINGNAISVGGTATLPSGATVKLEANGTLTYDPNDQFNTLTSTASGQTGAVNTSAPDSFTYTLAGTGGGTATVSVTVNGVVSVEDHLDGNSGANTINGTTGGDYFDLSQGGNDTANGLGGNDGFYFGAEFTAADTVDGGAGTNDQIGLKGNYSGGLTLGATTMKNVEVIVVLPGFSYNITTNDANVASGELLSVQATQLAAGQNLTFNGAAETNGRFMIYGGGGNDNFTGGAGNDGFYFGPSQFNASDTVNGGAGTNDQLGLDGNYTIASFGGNFSNVEVVVLLHGPTGTPNTFNITANNALVAASQTMTIFALQVETPVTFDGTAELDGAFKIYGGTGNDVLRGGSGADWIFGGEGGDTLSGGDGNDTFSYDAATQSTPLGRDGIQDFRTGDILDLSGIDAIDGGANDAFTFIGGASFGNHAGELRAESNGSIWTVSGDTDGDGDADFEVIVVAADSHPLTGADFTL